MSTMYIPKPSDLANRTYWDVFGAEAESLCIEQKIISLGTFALNGGSFSDVVDLYVEGRDGPAQLDSIQWAVFYYLEYMINARESLQPYEFSPTALRIMRLEKEELLELLERELMRCVTLDPDGHYVFTDVSCCNDHNLDAIERRHWRDNPEESFQHYSDKSKRWDRRRPGLWNPSR